MMIYVNITYIYLHLPYKSTVRGSYMVPFRESTNLRSSQVVFREFQGSENLRVRVCKFTAAYVSMVNATQCRTLLSLDWVWVVNSTFEAVQRCFTPRWLWAVKLKRCRFPAFSAQLQKAPGGGPTGCRLGVEHEEISTTGWWKHHGNIRVPCATLALRPY